MVCTNASEVEAAHLVYAPLEVGDVVLLNFADDTHVFGATKWAVSYAATLFSKALGRMNQKLNTPKRRDHVPRRHVWRARQLPAHRSTTTTASSSWRRPCGATRCAASHACTRAAAQPDRRRASRPRRPEEPRPRCSAACVGPPAQNRVQQRPMRRRRDSPHEQKLSCRSPVEETPP